MELKTQDAASLEQQVELLQVLVQQLEASTAIAEAEKGRALHQSQQVIWIEGLVLTATLQAALSQLLRGERHREQGTALHSMTQHMHIDRNSALHRTMVEPALDSQRAQAVRALSRLLAIWV